ncbi:MAG: 30S ribosomal protein S8 [Candidatus Coatesbacteria bacterium]|nr:MAG: 30S ribosomal protein S8 [Candidatus Coatesbacteria bacterium]
MTMTDPIADLLTRIRNANRAGYDKTDVPFSTMKESLCQILKEEGFIEGYRVLEQEPGDVVRIYLKYGEDKEKFLTDLQRVSRPGLRVYVDKEQIPRVLGGIGVAIISTSQGMMTDAEARKRGIGGEVICKVW